MNGIFAPCPSPRSRGSLLAATATLMIAIVIGVLAARQPASAGSQPDFLLPWQHGQTWLTGSAGFHNANDALDFFPPDTPLSGTVKCEGDPDWVLQISSYYVVASAPGIVVQASNASVLIDHGGGWFSRYYHMTSFVVAPDDNVAAGQPLARPSTLGFCSSGPHNHFWVQGPDGETTRDVTLSGIPSTQIGINEYISDTGNHPPGSTATPTPTTTAAPAPSDTPIPSPSPTPLILGDANCDGLVNGVDATTALHLVIGKTNGDCPITSADIDCDSLVTMNDVLDILRHVSDLATIAIQSCPTLSATPAPQATASPLP